MRTWLQCSARYSTASSVFCCRKGLGTCCASPTRTSRSSRLLGSKVFGTAPKEILLLDVMDTKVVDPFFKEMPKFFGMTFDELMKSKSPTAWPAFERGEIDQDELFKQFFNDRRSFDGQALVKAMADAYHFVDGMDSLLKEIKDSGYEIHAMSNYPVWYKLIESKLSLSKYLQWTFVSCEGPMKGLRKPSPAAFEAAAATLDVPIENLIFVDDRAVNVEAARATGIDGIVFKDVANLRDELVQRGLEIE
jgi:FMN phosphatase YigB (HAD superfamily)